MNACFIVYNLPNNIFYNKQFLKYLYNGMDQSCAQDFLLKEFLKHFIEYIYLSVLVFIFKFL